MQLSELNLDLKELATAPMAIRGVVLTLVFAAVLAAGYYFHLSAELDGLNALKNEEQGLRDVYAQKKGQARNLEIYRQQYRQTEQALAALLKKLPNKAEVDALLTDINQAGLSRGLQFELFRPGTLAYADFYATLPVTIKVIGTYHEIGAFVSDVAHLPRIVTLHDITVAPVKGNKLSMDATLKTYRYLDESESAAARKKAQESSGNKPKGGVK